MSNSNEPRKKSLVGEVMAKDLHITHHNDKTGLVKLQNVEASPSDVEEHEKSAAERQAIQGLAQVVVQGAVGADGAVMKPSKLKEQRKSSGEGVVSPGRKPVLSARKSAHTGEESVEKNLLSPGREDSSSHNRRPSLMDAPNGIVGSGGSGGRRSMSLMSDALRESSSSSHSGKTLPVEVARNELSPRPTSPTKRVLSPRGGNYMLPVGTVLGPYTIGEKLGTGRVGSVYKSFSNESGEFVAIKQINKRVASKKDQARVVAEARGSLLMKRLKHPNICGFIDVFDSSSNLIFVLEYVESSLEKLIRLYGVLKEKLTLVYMKQVLEGLIYLHENGVCHRDLRASNLLISKQGVIKLTYFGISHLISIDSKQNDTLATLRANKSLAGTGIEEAISSPYWMAPEVIAGEETTTASDIWSVGCTVIELMSRVPPFFDLSVREACLRIFDTPISYPGGLSKKGKKFLDLCFEKDPTKRISAKKLLEFLEQDDSSKKVASVAAPAPVAPAAAPASDPAPKTEVPLEKSGEMKALRVSDSGAIPSSILSPRGNVDFFERVKTETDPSVYNEFLILMKRFKLKQIDAQEVSRCAAKLFRNQKEIIGDFNNFLPKKYRIDINALEANPKNEEELEQLYSMLQEYRLTQFYDVIADRCDGIADFCGLSSTDLEGLGLKKFHVKKAAQIQQILFTKRPEKKQEENAQPEEETHEKKKEEEENVEEEKEDVAFEIGEELVANAAETLRAVEQDEREESDEEEEESG